MFRTSTKSKNLRIPRLEKIGLEGDLGTLKMINLNASFGESKFDDKLNCPATPIFDMRSACEKRRLRDRCLLRSNLSKV